MNVRITKEFKTKKRAENALEALKYKKEFKRSKTKLSTQENVLVLEFESEEVGPLRASINTNLRLLKIIEDLEVE